MVATCEETNCGFVWNTVEAGHFRIFTTVSAFIVIFSLMMIEISTDKLDSS
jgi:hypothetical protein